MSIAVGGRKRDGTKLIYISVDLTENSGNNQTKKVTKRLCMSTIFVHLAPRFHLLFRKMLTLLRFSPYARYSSNQSIGSHRSYTAMYDLSCFADSAAVS